MIRNSVLKNIKMMIHICIQLVVMLLVFFIIFLKNTLSNLSLIANFLTVKDSLRFILIISGINILMLSNQQISIKIDMISQQMMIQK